MEVDAVAAGHRPDAPYAAPGDPGGVGVAQQAVLAVAAAVDALAVVDLTVPGTGAVLDLLRSVEQQTRRLQAVSVAIIGQMEHRGLAAPAGQTSTVSLVRQVINIGRSDAAARVRLAAAICPGIGLSGAAVPARRPLLAAAVAAGTVGAKHADLIGWVFTSFPAAVQVTLQDSVEEFLVAEAAGLDPVTFENVCRKIVLMANPDGPDEERNAHERQQFHIGSRRPNGLTKVWGLLDDLTVEALRAAFGAMGAPAAHRSKHAPTEQPTPAEPTPTEPTPPDQPPAQQTQGEPTPNQATPTAPTPNAPTPAGQPPTPDTTCPADPHPPTTTPQDTAPQDTAPQDTAPQDSPPAAPTSIAPPDTDLIDTDLTDTDTDPAEPGRPIYHPQRLPYDWAPLGTVPGDYLTDPPSPPNAAPSPPDAAPSPPDPTGPPPLTPRLFDDDPDPDGLNPDGTPRQTDPTGTPPAATTRAHALGTIINHFLNTGAAPTQGGEKPHLLVTVDEKSLRDRIGHGHLGYGTHIPIDTIRMIACDSQIIAAVLGATSQPLDIGRASRTFNAATTRALLLRDKGCIFPGCDTPGLWTENHHITHWADGGNSDYTNGCLLCRRHHTLIHHSDWTIRTAPDGTPEAIPPTTHDPTQTPLRNTLHHPPTFPWPQKV